MITISKRRIKELDAVVGRLGLYVWYALPGRDYEDDNLNSSVDEYFDGDGEFEVCCVNICSSNDYDGIYFIQSPTDEEILWFKTMDDLS